MNESNLDRLCRLCLNNSFFHIHIYVGQSMDNNPIYEVINYVYDLEISVDDGLPEYICGKCLAKLKEFETYKLKVHKAKSELLSLKRNVEEVSVKEEEIDETEFVAEQNETVIQTPKEERHEELVPDEDSGRGNQLEIYIKQEKMEEDYLHSNSEEERMEKLDQVPYVQVHSNLGSNRESVPSCASVSREEESSVTSLGPRPKSPYFAQPTAPSSKKAKRNLSVAEQSNIELLQACTEALRKGNDVNEFDAVGISVASKLKRMDPLQAIYAEMLINTVLGRGLLKTLTANTGVRDCNQRTVLPIHSSASSNRTDDCDLTQCDQDSGQNVSNL